MDATRKVEWRLGAAMLFVVSWLACRSTGVTPPAGGVSTLVDGPTQWLMLPEEQRQARRLGSTREAVAFVESFWRRRDPDPASPGNEFSRLFYERVEAADRLYDEGGTRGSLTERGRALILLGPPSVQRYSQKRVPAWEPGKPDTKPIVRSQSLVLESWVYQTSDLPPELVELLSVDGPPPVEIELVFVIESRHTRLIEGEKYLETAVRSAVRE